MQNSAVLAFFLFLVFTSWITTPLRAQQRVTGYAGQWTNPSGQPAVFHLSGTENPETELYMYNAYYEAVGTVMANVKPQSIAVDNTEPWKDGVEFDPTTLDLPDLPNGVYKLDGPELTNTAVPFLVGDPQADAEIVIIYPTNTINAYSRTKGIGLYQRINGGARPEAVSFQRPQSLVWLSRGLERLMIDGDYDVNFIADHDLESYDAISGSKLVIIPGHSEYWTDAARRNFDQFVDHGGSALVLSGNTMFRQIVYDDSENPTQVIFSPRVNYTSPSAGYQTYESIGVDYEYGGNGSNWASQIPLINMPYDGWKILDASPSYLADVGVKEGDIIHDPGSELDGVPYAECDPITGPVVDQELLRHYRTDVIAFENTANDTCGSWVDFNKTEDSGRIIVVGSTSAALLAGDNAKLKRDIVANMIELLLTEQADFDGNERLTSKDIDLLVNEMQQETHRTRFDLTEDGFVTVDDIERWVADFAGTALGDLNVDGAVGFTDYLQFSQNFGRKNSTWSQGNFNGDDIVDFEDFLSLTTNYGFRAGDSFGWAFDRVGSVPEPDCNLLFLVGVFCVATTRRARIVPRHSR